MNNDIESVDSHSGINRVRRLEDREEAMFFDLVKLGVGYLANNFPAYYTREQSIDEFLAPLITQADRRIRNVFIAEMLIHPEYSSKVPAVLKRLRRQDQSLMKLLYSTAVFLQKKYRAELEVFLLKNWQDLPDLYSTKLIRTLSSSPNDNLWLIGKEYQLQTGELIDWPEVCDHLVRQLLKRQDLFSRGVL